MKKYEGKGMVDALHLAFEAGKRGETFLPRSFLVNGGYVIFQTDGVEEDIPEANEGVFDKQPYIDVIEKGTKADIIEAFSEIGVELNESLNKSDLKESAYNSLEKLEV